jgi:myosin heavy subunit
LENRAKGRYDALDRMSSELHRLQEQRDALHALVEALRTEDEWLAYRAEALRDQLLELEGRPTEGASTVEAVRTTLVDRDEVLRRARQDLVGAHAVAAEWEEKVVSARAQLQRDRAALEGARAWQSQTEERAKEAEKLRASLTNKAVTVVTTEEQLRQERVARQEAEGQLQQEWTALAEARAALEREHLAREEALGRLQQERAALEGARAALKQREDEASKLNRELVQLSISHEDLHQFLEEQEATVLDLRRKAEEARKALEVEKKQVEGELLSICFSFCRFVFRGFAPNFLLLCLSLSGSRTTLGNTTTQAEVVQTAYNSSQQEFEALEAATLEICEEEEEGAAQAGSSLASRLRALGGHVSQRMHRALHLGVKKALGVVASHYQVDFEAVSSGYIVPVGVEDEVAMDRADALAATAADTLSEDFMDFLFPDAPGVDDPQA